MNKNGFLDYKKKVLKLHQLFPSKFSVHQDVINIIQLTYRVSKIKFMVNKSYVFLGIKNIITKNSLNDLM